MFTGLIEQVGVVIANTSQGDALCLIISAQFEGLTMGESIAVNGVCLTLSALQGNSLVFNVSPETSAITTLGKVQVGDYVNLERAAMSATRLGGHYVTGHVDTTAYLMAINYVDDYQEIVVGNFFEQADLYIFPKASITLEGVSLTINAVSRENTIKLMLVPHTLRNTTLGRMNINQRLNVEFDYLARIVAHQLDVAGRLVNEVEV